MTVLAGIDVGNATTEVVIGRLSSGRLEVVAAGRAPTRRGKGSAESLAGAVALVRRLERQHDIRVTRAAAAPLRPVETRTASLPEEPPDTGRLQLVRAGSATAGGTGFGAGRPVRLGDLASSNETVVVVVPAGVGYESAAADLAGPAAEGLVAAVLLEDDEAVLIANRLPDRLTVPIPVVDQVVAADVLGATRVAVEVAPPGRALQHLTDPLRLAAALGLSETELANAARLAPLLFDASNAVVTMTAERRQPPPPAGGWVELRERGRLPFLAAHPWIVAGDVRAACGYALADEEEVPVDDLWTVDLTAVASAVGARRGVTAARPVGLAALRSEAGYVDPTHRLAALLDVPVDLAPSEAGAARAGALSTPGAGSEVVVIDLGGGTVDVVTEGSAVVAAGAGDLLTLSVSALTGCTGAAAEWVKRGPAQRVETPQLLLGEDGSRRFLDRPAPRDTIGALVVDGPAGLLPFSRTSAPGEWRGLRSRLKVELVGGNVARALRTLGAEPATVLAVGGPAGDEEILAALSGALPVGTAVSRGNVAGELGHRYAVAYGLLRTAAGAP